MPGGVNEAARRCQANMPPSNHRTGQVTADEQVMRDVISALLNLGYRQQEAERAVRAARAKQNGSLTLEALLKDALQALAR